MVNNKSSLFRYSNLKYLVCVGIVVWVYFWLISSSYSVVDKSRRDNLKNEILTGANIATRANSYKLKALPSDDSYADLWGVKSSTGLYVSHLADCSSENVGFISSLSIIRGNWTLLDSVEGDGNLKGFSLISPYNGWLCVGSDDSAELLLHSSSSEVVVHYSSLDKFRICVR